MKIAIVGSFPPPIGGTAISLQELTNSLCNQNLYALEVFDTSQMKSGSLYKRIVLILKLFQVIKKSQIISLHLAIKQYAFIGILIILISKILKRRVILRRFGGMNIEDINNSIIKMGVLFSHMFSDLIFCQTKRQIQELEDKGLKAHIQWFPTSRTSTKLHLLRAGRFEIKYKLIFISQIKIEKGIFFLIDAFKRLHKVMEQVELNIYGPLFDEITPSQIEQNNAIKYGGLLDHLDVQRALASSDCLIFPSFYQGEGYSGVLIEAMQTGTPIIATNWKFNYELLEGAAIYVPIKDSDAIYQALLKIYQNKNTLPELSARSYERGKLFSQDRQTSIFNRAIDILVGSDNEKIN